METNRKLVLSGNIRQYKEFLHENDFSEKEYIYVDSLDKMRGYRFDDVICIGTFWDRKNAGEFYDLAMERNLSQHEAGKGE